MTCFCGSDLIASDTRSLAGSDPEQQGVALCMQDDAPHRAARENEAKRLLDRARGIEYRADQEHRGAAAADNERAWRHRRAAEALLAETWPAVPADLEARTAKRAGVEVLP